MSILADLSRLSSAEEFFIALDVPFQQDVINVARLHILRRMGQYLGSTDFDGLSDAEARVACRAQLGRAYQDFLHSSPIAERVFKVHQDALKPVEKRPLPFVPLSSLTGGPQ